VQEADAVPGVQRARDGRGRRPLLAYPVGGLPLLAVGEDVGPPQGVDDEEGQYHPDGDEDLTEDADGGRDPSPLAALGRRHAVPFFLELFEFAFAFTEPGAAVAIR
jgi:hypothetical protein